MQSLIARRQWLKPAQRPLVSRGFVRHKLSCKQDFRLEFCEQAE